MKKIKPLDIPECAPLNEYELGLVEHQTNGLKTIDHLLLMKKTEYEAFIQTGLSPNYKPSKPKYSRDKFTRVCGTKFQLAEDEEGREFALIGGEYVPLDLIPKDKHYKEKS